MLDDLLNTINSLKNFDTEAEVDQIIANNLGKLVELQKTQLLEGRGKDGEYIRPFYSEDPYFKTKESAERYATWKSIITPNDKRPKDVPNLFINGKYVHNTLVVKLTKETYDILSDNAMGEKILQEHPNAAGLDEEKRLEFATTITLPEFAKVFQSKTGLKI